MQTIIRALTGAAAIYNEVLSQDRLDGYLVALSDQNEADVVVAIGEAVKRFDFFPKPAQIIVIAKGIKWNRIHREIKEESVPDSEHAKAEVTELLADFKKRMKWD